MTQANQRKIIHVDCDCFYAAVEMRDNPALADKPLGIGGSPSGRGVIATCNYPARAFGIRSAMPAATALRLCPDIVLMKPNMEKYRQVSKQIRDIFLAYTPLIEPLSLDEAYLDVSDVTLFSGSATLIAKDIRSRVEKEIGITVSAGVAPNKFLAKIASDWNKPNGLCVITPNQVEDFVRALPVSKLFGVGKKTAEKLHSLGFETCDDLRNADQAMLSKRFGKFGKCLHELAWGIDNRPVKTERVAKSLSTETTFAHDVVVGEALQHAIVKLHCHFLERLARRKTPPIKGLFVKVKFADFTTTTHSHQGNSTKLEDFLPLMETATQRKNMPIRLIGMGVQFGKEPSTNQQQSDLFNSI